MIPRRKVQVNYRKTTYGLIVTVILLIGGFAYVQATSAPTKGWALTGGDQGPCSWFMYLDGTTPEARAMVQETISGTTYQAGDNYGGSAGADIGAFVNNLIASNTRICAGAGTFNLSSQILGSGVSSFSIVGMGNQTLFQATANFPNGQDVIKFINCADLRLSSFKVIGHQSAAGGGDITVQNCKQVNMDHVVATQSGDNGIWLCGDTATVSLDYMILYNNGFSTDSVNNNNGGLEIDANTCTGGANDGVSVSNSFAYSNWGPGFSVHNCGGSTTNPCAAGKKPNTHIQFANDVSYNNKNGGGSTNSGTGFGTYHWNDTSFVNCKTYGNAYAGFFINGNTNGALTIVGQSDEITPAVPYVTTATYADAKNVHIQIARYNPSGVSLVTGGAYGAFLIQTTVTTSSATYVSAGFGVTVTPVLSGNFLINLFGTFSDGSTAQVNMAVYRNTVGVPVSGTAVGTDQQVVTTAQTISTTNKVNAAIVVFDNNVSVGTAYAYYAAWSVTAGTGTWTQFQGDITVNEI